MGMRTLRSFNGLLYVKKENTFKTPDATLIL